MSEKLPIYIRVSKIRFKGTLDFQGLYDLMRSWYNENGYECWEKKYKHKGNEVEIEWEGYREETEFRKEWVRVFFHVWDWKEIEAIIDGKKKKLIRCRMFIEFTAELEFDYENQWETSWLKRKLRHFYIYHVMWKEIDVIFGDKAFYNVNKLQQRVKRFLEMEAESEVYDDMW